MSAGSGEDAHLAGGAGLAVGARVAVAGAAGAVFGLGLSISGMIDPRRVLGFLDLGGAWDPSLAIASCLSRPMLDDRFHLPAKRPIDARLIAGSAIFGVGWGLVGLCPGPALAAAAIAPAALAFVAAMALGAWLHDRFARDAA